MMLCEGEWEGGGGLGGVLFDLSVIFVGVFVSDGEVSGLFRRCAGIEAAREFVWAVEWVTGMHRGWLRDIRVGSARSAFMDIGEGHLG